MAIFGDELDPDTMFTGTNFSDTQWAMFGFDEINQATSLLAATDPLELNKAYWIQQVTGTPVVLDTPDTFTSVVTDLCAEVARMCSLRELISLGSTSRTVHTHRLICAFIVRWLCNAHKPCQPNLDQTRANDQIINAVVVEDPTSLTEKPKVSVAHDA